MSDQRTAARPWRNALFATFLAMGLVLGAWITRLPAIRDALGLGLDQVGQLLFALALGSLIGLMGAGALTTRFGTRSVGRVTLPAAFIMLGLIGIAVGVAESIPLAVAAFVGLGMVFSIADVAINVSAAASERVLGQELMPVYHGFFSLGAVVGTALGTAAEAAQLPIAVHFGIMSVFGIVISLVALRFLHDESEAFAVEGETSADTVDAGPPVGRLRTLVQAWAQPRTLLIGVVVLAAAFAEGAGNDWLSLAMVDGHGFDKPGAGLVLLVFTGAMTITRFSGIWLLARLGRVVVVRGSLIIAIAGLLLISLVPNPAAAVVGAALWGIGAAIGFPVGMSAAADNPVGAAARVSVVATIGYLAFLVGPPVLGLIAEETHILTALLVVAGLLVMGVVTAGAMRKPGELTTDTRSPSDAG